MSAEHLDVIVIGAGLSGVGMACHLAQLCPGKQMAILERRHAIGGTWDLFRYPGVRSDSDMFSFGYQFRPWNDLQVLADGESIRRYINDTAAEHGIIDKIRFGVDIILSQAWNAFKGNAFIRRPGRRIWITGIKKS